MCPRLTSALAVLCWCLLITGTAGGRSLHRLRLPSFYAIAMAAGTDKVTVHRYHHMYDRYLPQYRQTPVHFLEIGLGCDMTYGPGRSMQVWYKYFIHFNSTIDFMEYDGACAEKFKALSTRGQILVGDQGREEHLQRVVDRAQQIGGYDVIIDDGGHTMHQQKLTFERLWPVLRPGGMLVIEDLQTSYQKGFGGGPVGTPDTTIAWLKTVIDLLNCRQQKPQATDCIPGLLNMDCYEKVCVFTKVARD